MLGSYHRDQIAKFLPLIEGGDDQQPPERNTVTMPPRVRVAVSEALRTLFQGKCAYCERPAADMDQFRPRWRADRTGGRVDPAHYWWLASDWHNLYLCCHECNARKANLFPILGDPAAPGTFGDGLRKEQPLLIDPCFDRPEDHFHFSADGTVSPRTTRGAATIKVFELNSAALIAGRRASAALATQACESLWVERRGNIPDPNTYRQDVLARLMPETPYLAVICAVVEDYIRARSGVPNTPPPQQIIPAIVDELPSIVWLDRIEVSNFKTISALDLSFPKTPEDEEQKSQPWLMLLGENSVGKSSLLQAVALALMPDSERDRYGRADAHLSKRRGVEAGYVRLTFTDGSQRTLSFAKKSKQFHVTGHAPAIPVLAYGSVRLLPKSRARKPDNPSRVSVGNLFEHAQPLVNAEQYLCDIERVSAARFRLLAESLKNLLPIDEEAEITRTGSTLRSKIDGNTLPLRELSDGYKSMLALAMDIMFHLTTSSFDMESAQGLVLVDEIEVHLHPRWKIRIVDQLRTLFPRVRFIVSTHDPLCLQGLRKGELHVMAKHPGDRRFIVEQINVPSGTRSDEILTGPWFGLSSTMDAETLGWMSEHSALLQHELRSDGEEQRMRKLEDDLRQRMGTFGNTRAQRAAMAAAAVLDRAPSHHADQIIQHRLKRILSDEPRLQEGGDA